MFVKIYKYLWHNFPALALLGKRVTRPVRLLLDRRVEVAANFQGDQFMRFSELGAVLAKAEKKSILDIGMSDGLIAYEFARHGAAVIHGLEIDDERVRFAKRLFSNVPVESQFAAYNIALEKTGFLHSKSFRGKYDIVLFLGVYQHIQKQMKREDLDEFVNTLTQITENLLVVRTNKLAEFEHDIIAAGFTKWEAAPETPVAIGKLGIFERNKTDNP